ncbi:ubiquitin-like protein ATG12 [Hemicordylus capensis]|uniref:ubiquitin-like protein ATG12 n=1 Tax=Hemicordylus capensis TaxID=884348 RepID=UPI002304C91E|nr:ubiquitin-like protein ATG12 [Hemicordylus capensis]
MQQRFCLETKALCVHATVLVTCFLKELIKVGLRGRLFLLPVMSEGNGELLPPILLSPQDGGRGEGGEEAAEGGGTAGAAVGVLEPAPASAVSPVTEEPAGDTRKKIDVLLKAVGDTPIMKTKKWNVERTRTIQGLIDFIKKFLKLVASEQLFIYVNQSFAPSPDQEVGTLYECFGSDGKLVLHYCKSQAWG